MTIKCPKHTALSRKLSWACTKNDTGYTKTKYKPDQFKLREMCGKCLRDSNPIRNINNRHNIIIRVDCGGGAGVRGVEVSNLK